MTTVAILAGGAASRFDGVDKSALVVEGRPILDRQLQEIRRLADLSDILVVGSHPLRQQQPGPGVRYVEDASPGCGPLGGMVTAFAETGAERLLIVACDMPFVTAPLLAHLARLTEGADAVVPETEGGYHPLCAAYTRACEPKARARLQDRRLAVRGLLDDVRVRVVSSEELAIFGDPTRLLANVNSPAALQWIEAQKIHEA
ncbi:MAG TPA: molybdenum cofactor guanylyltransferase [Vicinamibacterales bacterium]|nr:molybdenum cofactor guanylyltransferase [Vicinamibacterales bacterium]